MEETRGQGVPFCVAGEGSRIRTDLICCLCFPRFRSAPQKWGVLVGQVLLYQLLCGTASFQDPPHLEVCLFLPSPPREQGDGRVLRRAQCRG